MDTFFHKLKNLKQFKLRISTLKFSIKKLFFISFILSTSLVPFSLSGQLGSIFKNVIKNSAIKSAEKEIIHEAAVNSTKQISKTTRLILKNSDEVFIRISKELKLSEGFKKNIDDFSDFLFDMGTEMFTNPDVENLNSSKNNIIDELNLNNINKDLFKLLCKKFGKDSLNNNELKLAFTGQKVNNIAISKENLYKLYFIISPTFAENEIIKLKEFYSNNKPNQLIIDNLIQGKDNSIDKSSKSSEDESTSFSDLMFTIVVIIIALLIIYNIVKKITFVVKKTVSFFKRN